MLLLHQKKRYTKAIKTKDISNVPQFCVSSIDIDGNDDYFEEVWTDKVIILWRNACHRPLNTQTGGGEGD